MNRQGETAEKNAHPPQLDSSKFSTVQNCVVWMLNPGILTALPSLLRVKLCQTPLNPVGTAQGEQLFAVPWSSIRWLVWLIGCSWLCAADIQAVLFPPKEIKHSASGCSNSGNHHQRQFNSNKQTISTFAQCACLRVRRVEHSREGNNRVSPTRPGHCSTVTLDRVTPSVTAAEQLPPVLSWCGHATYSCCQAV